MTEEPEAEKSGKLPVLPAGDLNELSQAELAAITNLVNYTGASMSALLRFRALVLREDVKGRNAGEIATP
ncbi:hypothetical protein ACWDBD_11530 [Streptomyces sp. NPDC001118]